jgi:two-component system phosphate regulon sensor histidine kinase PhoR
VFGSIRWRIAIPTILIIILSMISLGAALSNLVRQSKLQDIQQGQETALRLLADQLEDLEPPLDPLTIDARVDEWASIAQMRITVIAANGEVIGESHEDYSQMENHADRPEFMQAMSTGSGHSLRHSDTLGVDMLYSALAFERGGERAGVVRAAFPLTTLQSEIQQLQRTVWLSTGLGVLIMAAVALWIAGRAANSLAELIHSTRKIEAGDLKVRILPRTRDEVGQLALALDSMAGQLRTRFEALQAEQAKLATVLSQMTDGVLLVDNQGIVVLANAAAQAMFGLQAETSLEMPLIRLSKAHQIVDLWKECVRSGEIQVIELQLAERKQTLLATAIPLEATLKEHTLFILNDLTEIRRLETIRRDFLSNISHELRTPLASLKALSETLEMGALEEPQAAQRFIDLMKSELEALAHLVSELLELSRIESGQVPLKLSPVEPCALLGQVAERMALQAEQAHLALHTGCPAGLSPVLADPPRLEQVLLNLAHNAVKFTPPGGKVTLQASASGEVIVFKVQDTGVGIPSQDLPRVFERFYKTRQGRQREGTGLGLAIAKHLVEAHGGQIWVESVEGHGSSFFFSIPMA